MTFFQALILGILQGLTEFIPVSSSGHLVLVPTLLGWEVQSTSFDIVVHGGTLLALFIFFKKDLLKLMSSSQRNAKLLLNLILTTIPALIVGLIFSNLIDKHLKDISVIVIMLFVVGVIMIFIDSLSANNKKHYKELKPLEAFIIGLFQTIAFIRGTSRSGITTIGGSFMKLKIASAAKYAFLGAIPITLAVFVKQLFDFTQEGIGYLSLMSLITGFLSSFISGLFAISFMLNYLKKKGLFIFGIYRIVLAVLIYLVVLL
jgi:undecaprenyl-diphosphatase